MHHTTQHAASDLTRARDTWTPPNRHRATWRHHKQWIREVILHGTPYAAAAAACGYSRVTAWAVLQRPDVKRYVSSLRRWQADRALQARIERDATLGEVPGADDVLS